MSKLKKLAGETVLYGLGSIVPKVLNFFLLPLHTRHMFHPSEYGIVTGLLAYVGVLNVVYTFGMETAFFRFATAPDTDAKKIFNMAQTAVLSISALLSFFFILFAEPIAAGLHTDAHPEFIVWVVLIMLIDAAVAIPFARLRLERRPLRFAMAKIINVMLLIGLNIYFLKIDFDPTIGVGYIFLANLIANGFYLLFFAGDLIAWRPIFDKKVFGPMIRYSFPVMLTGLAGMTNEMFSRATLDLWLPLNFYPGTSREHALGVFGANYKFAAFMNIAISAFKYAAEPFFFSNAADKNSPALFARVNHYFVITCCFLLLAVTINMDVINRLMTGEEYWEGVGIVPILLLAYLFTGVYYNFTVWFKVTDRTYFGTIISVGGAMLTVLLNFILIPVAGYAGSSWAAMIVALLMAISCYILGRKYYPIPYRIVPDSIYIAATFLLAYVVSKISLGNIYMSILFHLGIMLIFLAVAAFIETKLTKLSTDQQRMNGQ